MRKNIVIFLVSAIAIMLITNTLASAEYEGDVLLGTWLTQDKDSKIKIYKKNNKYHGKIIWLKEPNRNGKPKVDDKNPNEIKAKRKILYLVILTNFVYDGDYEWEDGEIYDPKTGNTYSCNMTLS